ncbi:MAG: dihydrolipoamide acetyltransferase family protein [Gemmatimonadota bacterium]|nr:dihydrolipoamide acetyltransferase family protein [Gemmatimonadota bacterium]
MAEPLIMPQLGQDIETGIIVEWLVRENDHLNKGDVYVIVESEKATLEVEAEESGVVLKLLYEEGDEAKVLEPIAYVGEPGEKWENTTEPALSSEAGKTEETAEEEAPEAERTGPDRELRVSAAPAARRAAAELGIDLAAIRGTGPGGRIVKKDVLAAASKASPAQGAELSASEEKLSPAAEDREIPFSKMRKIIAERLTTGKRNIPHFYLFADVDMTDTWKRRISYNEESRTGISVNDIIIKAAASALSEFPGMNAHVYHDRVILRKDINIGVAVSTDEGLLVPVIPHADRKNIQEISRLSRETANGARQGVLKAQSAGTFTISNLGMYSIDCFIPIINPPECAVLGVGSIVKRAVPLDDNRIGVRRIMALTLACDHRAVDGAYASGFLDSIRKNLEDFTF